jgi:predicted Zn-dependent protease
MRQITLTRYHREVGQITPASVSKASGDQIEPQVVEAFGGLDPDPLLNEYVRFVGEKMFPFSKKGDFEHAFAVLSSENAINAFALGNGHVYITKGLLKILDNEAELASVLSHEIGHVVNRHIAKQLDIAFAGTALAMIANAFAQKKGWQSSPILAQVGTVTLALVTSGYSQKHELEADNTGVEMVYKSGYNPFAFVNMLRRLQTLAPDSEGIQQYFASHPSFKRRISEIDAELRGKFRDPSPEVNRDRYHKVVFGTSEDTSTYPSSPAAALTAAAGLALLPVILSLL